MSTYILTQIDPHIACMGEFGSKERAIEYAHNIRDLGLCEVFSIGTYIDSKFKQIYNSREENAQAC